ncbi:MAG: DUF1549 domain-containing protein [Pirellulaceae bacterium]|nr:DUF1549 domain-containing protein [Pirellulaceae bacterium]
MVQRWQETGIVPVAQASNAEFFRRVSLDLNGLISRVAEVRGFLKDESGANES